MNPDDRKRTYRQELLAASAMIVAGLGMSGLALGRIATQTPQQMAQAPPPLQGTPSTTQGQAPAESKPGGERPTTPAPEPARPDAQAQQEAANPARPAAPAKKPAAPIQTK